MKKKIDFNSTCNIFRKKMEDKAFAYLYDGTNQTTMQKKNILEIAGQQIIGRNSKSLIVHTKSFLYI